ncbi:MAG TPA: DUF1266 domain-containing protein [Flavobacteriaceae bacterium]|nr:DUF1266 domain-containing protein [Flavobacteriaceae bacterium]
MRIASKLKRISLAFRGGLRLNNKNGLTGKKLDHVLTSSMYAMQDWAYLNSYETGLDDQQLEALVDHYWNIKDRHAGLEIINHLMKRNRSENLDALYVAYEIEDYPQYLKFKLYEDEEDIIKEYVKYFDRLKIIVPQLIEKEVFKEYAEVKKVQDSGWNLAQASFLIRSCYDLGYLQQQEVEALLERVYQELKTHCSTWQEYTASFILGREIDGWEHTNRIIWKAEKLLTDKRSPLSDKTHI